MGSAKLQMEMIHILLCEDAKRAKQIIAEYKPMFESKKAYFDYVDGLYCKGDRIEYGADGFARIKIGIMQEPDGASSPV